MTQHSQSQKKSNKKITGVLDSKKNYSIIDFGFSQTCRVGLSFFTRLIPLPDL